MDMESQILSKQKTSSSSREKVIAGKRKGSYIAYWHRKYHSGTICKGVSNPQTSDALSGCEKEEIPK